MIPKGAIRFIVLAIGLSVPSAAQLPLPKPSLETAVQASQPIEDPLRRTTPYGTVVSFIKAAQENDWNRAVEYLGPVKTDRKQLAQSLKQVLDRGLKVNLATLSKETGGNTSDDISLTRELVGVATIRGEKLVILLDLVQRKNQPPLWLFSPETLAKVPALSAALDEGGIPLYVPKLLQDRTLWGIALYRWIFVALFSSVCLATTWLLTSVILFLFRRAFRSRLQHNNDLDRIRFAAPVRLLLFACAISLGAIYITTTLLAHQLWLRLAIVLSVVATAWLALRCIDFISWSSIERLRRTQEQHEIATVQLLRGCAKGVAVIVALLVLLKTQGVNLSTAIAGLGIGGLAIAFAAQKTIENLFGTVMLVTDSPIRMGDLCRVGDQLGTIENIGIRSTRIRTLSRTLVTVPNGQVATMILENLGAREKMWFFHMIGLRHETPADQLRQVLGGIHAMLCQHAGVESESARVRFVNVGSFSFDLEIFAYVLTSDYSLFLKIQEELLLHIIEIVRASGAELALPSQMTYLASSTGDSVENASQGKVAETYDHKEDRPSQLVFPGR